jgi:single-strand DNA-binding protein
MNQGIFVGRITRDPDLRTSTTGTEICSFTIVIDRKFKNAAGDKQADFINCISFKNTAKFIASYFRKGSWISVRGPMQSGSYNNKDGVKIPKMECIVDEANFVGAKVSNPDPVAPPSFAGSEPAPSFAPAGGDGFFPAPDDDTSLPFDL